MVAIHSLYSAPANEVAYDLVRRFVLEAEEADLFSESLTLEIKAKREGKNVAEAVAALSNTDGGIVLVGVAGQPSVGEQRLVGVPRDELDSLASHLSGLLPDAMPEIIPIAIPSSQKLIIVLRVDADAVAHPVVLAGKVLYRIPGHTVPADRRQIIELSRRDARSGQPSFAATLPQQAPLPRGDAHFPLWADPEDWSSATLRVVGGLLLPRRILERPWLDTPARDAALKSLDASAVPDRLFELVPSHPPTAGWTVVQRRSASLKLHAPGTGEIETVGGIKIDASAFLTLSDRRLSLLAGLRWSRAEKDKPARLRFDQLHNTVFEIIRLISDTCRAVSTAINAAEPTGWLTWEGWLQPHPPFSAISVLDLDQFARDAADPGTGGYFPPAVPRSPGLDGLDQLARNWITVLLLELGFRGFEDQLDGRSHPPT